MQDEPIEAVIHDEVVFKEEDAPIQFIIDLIDQRAESNAQEVEATHYFITYNVIDAERLRSDRKLRISPLEGATERSNESESFGPNHHVRGRIKDEVKVYQIAVPKHDILGNGELKHRDRGSVIATEGSEIPEFPEEEYAQEVELAHQYITYNVYGAEIELRNEFRPAYVAEDFHDNVRDEENKLRHEFKLSTVGSSRAGRATTIPAIF